MRLAQRMLLAVMFMLAGAACTWAILTVMRPVEDPVDAFTFTYATVKEGRVGSTLALNTTAEWTLSPIGVNRSAGVVTGTRIEDGVEVNAGSILYEVDLRPVVIAEGDVPSFREIGEGTVGEDVEQLQHFLTEVGYFFGESDGRAQSGTVQAIRAWQDALGIEVTGTVGPGDLIFVPSLPMRVALDGKTVYRGATLSGGEEILQGLPAAPFFRIPVTEAQAVMVPTGTPINVSSPAGDIWSAFANEQTVDRDSGSSWITLIGPAGASVCADECGQIAVSGQSLLKAQIILVEDVEGLVVPSSALVTDSTSNIAVVDREGERHIVSVESSAKGISVIAGVEAGLEVRIPGQGKNEK
jgi:peptidoglycan hydrolase-like protein with peptidoglycan-binding domain